jgi:hypothetical protein
METEREGDSEVLRYTNPERFLDGRNEQLRRAMRERIMEKRTEARNYSYIEGILGLGNLILDGAMIYNNPRIFEDKYALGTAVVAGIVGVGLLYLSGRRHKQKKALDEELKNVGMNKSIDIKED